MVAHRTCGMPIIEKTATQAMNLMYSQRLAHFNARVEHVKAASPASNQRTVQRPSPSLPRPCA